MAKTLIRYATAADLSTLLEIDKSAFPIGMAYDSDELAYFMNHPGAKTLVLEADGEIAAFLIAHVENRGQAATLVTLDVLKPFRRSGYGSRLLRRSEEILAGHGVETYVLQVDVENTGAIAFYEQHGFQRRRVLKMYYANGHDAHLMTKKLRADDGT